MDLKNEKQYIFKVSESELNQIHSDLAVMLQILPDTIYDEVLICLHELVINSIQEMKRVHREEESITIDLIITQDEAVICLKDSGRGINEKQLCHRCQDPLRESGRGLDIITLLADWFCICAESNNCISYFVIKKIIT